MVDRTMKITSIKQQVKNKDRYSIFVDENYAFSLSESALIESGIVSGQELTSKELGEYKKLSADDKLRAKVLRYAAMRSRTKWEIEFYLQKNQASPALSEHILNMLSKLGLINDLEYARTFIRDRNLLRPTSKRKLYAELRKKRIDDKVVNHALEEIEETDDRTAIKAVIEKKRRQSKYQDNLKLSQYLARQGFRYDDIKDVLREEL